MNYISSSATSATTNAASSQNSNTVFASRSTLFRNRLTPIQTNHNNNNYFSNTISSTPNAAVRGGATNSNIMIISSCTTTPSSTRTQPPPSTTLNSLFDHHNNTSSNTKNVLGHSHSSSNLQQQTPSSSSRYASQPAALPQPLNYSNYSNYHNNPTNNTPFNNNNMIRATSPNNGFTSPHPQQALLKNTLQQQQQQPYSALGSSSSTLSSANTSGTTYAITTTSPPSTSSAGLNYHPSGYYLESGVVGKGNHPYHHQQNGSNNSSRNLQVLTVPGYMRPRSGLSDLRSSVDTSFTGGTEIEEDIEYLDNLSPHGGYLTPDESSVNSTRQLSPLTDDSDDIVESIDTIESFSRDTPTSSSSPLKQYNLAMISPQSPSPNSKQQQTQYIQKSQIQPQPQQHHPTSYSKMRPSTLNKSEILQPNTFVGANTELSTSPVARSQQVTPALANRATSPINHTPSSTLGSGTFFVPSNSYQQQPQQNVNNASSTAQSNTSSNMSIHTFSSQPSPSHHLYFKNKKASNSNPQPPPPQPIQQPTQLRARTPTTIMVNDLPLSESGPKNGNAQQPSSSSNHVNSGNGMSGKQIKQASTHPSKQLPPMKSEDASKPSHSPNSPKLPKTSGAYSAPTSSESNAKTPNSEVTSEKKSKKKPKQQKPQIIKNYKKGDFIGSGANGKVFLGYNVDDGKFFAIKECTFENVPEDVLETKLENLQREINLMKGLRHENIVQYYGAEVNGTTLNIFLEFVPGGSVSSLLRRYGRLSEDVTRQYTIQMLKGLKYLHDNRIIHRDIKGANILVSVEGKIKLADFGASRKIQDIMTLSTEFKSLTGTPHFMAPEVIMQTGHGRPADVWSIGCTIVEMYTGRPPFSEFTTAAAVMFHIAASTEMPSFPDFVSEGCKKFLARCFIRDPNKRATVDDLLNDPWITQIETTSDDESVATPTEPCSSFSSRSGGATVEDTTPSSGSFSPFLEFNNEDDSFFAPHVDMSSKISQDMKGDKQPLGVVEAKKGYNSKKDISQFLRKNSMWQSRSFNSSAWEMFKGENPDEIPSFDARKVESSDSSSDFEDEGEITNYFDESFSSLTNNYDHSELTPGKEFDGFNSLRTEYDANDVVVNTSPLNTIDEKPQEQKPLEKKKKERLRKVRRKLDEELRKEASTELPPPQLVSDSSPKKDKKKKKKPHSQIPSQLPPSTKPIEQDPLDSDLFPVIEIPKKSHYQMERERDEMKMEEEMKILQMEQELSKLDHDVMYPFPSQQSNMKLESPRKIPPIPQTSHSKSKSQPTPRERPRIKSAPIKRISSDELSDTISPITQLGKATSPTKSPGALKPLQVKEYR
ncbi:hypothetical protein C9374_014167 [Naegleria lovaniensis]|uniref:Protein kinase domain-containing protein n=1 Tax=Naegleria lovaniensis TaxID=51637 RepID=A0AA88KV47_NAELO|nr:uncharacterized protein C9374_014167 [Naegleria lovaniensis]KAG2389607.1 hypothetical protein C9374_014167 [Naegleria lovaniensis]